MWKSGVSVNQQNQTHARSLPPFPCLLTSGGLLSLYHCA
jgi:hypothetical protein